jgi:hypothetical protein
VSVGLSRPRSRGHKRGINHCLTTPTRDQLVSPRVDVNTGFSPARRTLIGRCAHLVMKGSGVRVSPSALPICRAAIPSPPVRLRVTLLAAVIVAPATCLSIRMPSREARDGERTAASS